MKSGIRVADNRRDGGRRRAADAGRLGLALLALDAPVAALVGVVLVVSLGLLLAAVQSIWIDEAFTLHTTAAGVAQAWSRTVSFEAQPPLYFVLEAAFRSLDEASVTFARVPSVAFAAAAVAVIVFAARRIVPGVPPVIVALTGSLNPLVLWAAAETRVYALALLIGAALTWAFYEAFIVPTPARRAVVWYAALAVAGMYTQYYIAFVLVSHGITLLALRRGALRAFIVTGVIVSAAFLPFAGTALMHARASSEFVVHVSLLHSIHQVVDTVFVVMLPHDLAWHGLAKILGFAFAAALVAVLVTVGRPALRRLADAVVVQWLVYLVIFCVLFAIVGVPLAPLKYLIAMAPSSLLVAFIFVSSLRRMRKRLAVLALVAYAGFAIGTLGTTYRPPFEKPGEWRALASTLQNEAGATPIAVFPAELAEPLRWYYKGDLIPLPGPMPYTLDYVQRLTLSGEAEVARVLDPLAAGAGRLWVVTTGDCGRRSSDIYDYHCEYLESYLDRRYRLVRSVPFRGSSARLYSRLP